MNKRRIAETVEAETIVVRCGVLSLSVVYRSCRRLCCHELANDNLLCTFLYIVYTTVIGNGSLRTTRFLKKEKRKKERSRMERLQDAAGAVTTTTVTTTTTTTTWVFLVGNCAEWNEGRSSHGDVRLFEAFLESGVPRSQTVLVKDEACTTIHTQECFRSFLSRTRPGDTLVFYYGGHGSDEGAFETLGEEEEGHWQHQDVVNCIEECFRGDKVWALIDCCHSGSFARCIPPNTPKTYLLIMSASPKQEAGPEWSLTGVFLYGMMGRLDDDGTTTTTINTVLSRLAHQACCIKRNWMWIYLQGDAIDPMGPFPFRCPPTTNTTIVNPNYTLAWQWWWQTIVWMTTFLLWVGSFVGISSNSSNNNNDDDNDDDDCDGEGTVELEHENPCWREMSCTCHTGDAVYAQWKGGFVEGQYEPPMYFSSRVESTATIHNPPLMMDSFHKNVFVTMTNPMTNQTWRASHPIRQNTLLHHSYFDPLGDSDCLVKAVATLALHGRYLDPSIPLETRVWAIWQDDDELYPGQVISVVRLGDLQEECERESYRNITGPFLVIYWYEEGTYTLMPRSHCVVQGNHKPSAKFVRGQAESRRNDPWLSPIAAMHEHYRLHNKRIVSVEQAFGVSQVCGYWDGQLYNAVASPRLPIDTLAKHIYFYQAGDYCVVQWENEDTISVMPKTLLRPRPPL